MTRLILAAALGVIAMPASAQGLHETHRELAMPIGKTVRLYRPVRPADCAPAVRHHQAGKTLYAPARAGETPGCATRQAAVPAAERVAAR